MMYAHIGKIRAQAELTDGAGGGTANLPPTVASHYPLSSLHRQLQTAAAPLQWGGEALSVRSAGMLVRHHSGGRFVTALPRP